MAAEWEDGSIRAIDSGARGNFGKFWEIGGAVGFDLQKSVWG
jgi:hypothetical protein